MANLVDLSPDQTNWLLAFFTVVTTLLILYSINFAKGMDNFKKEKKDTRNAIKNSMEVQNVRPIMVNVFTLLSSKIDLTESASLEDELESIIYSTETWVKLDTGIRNLEEKVKEMAEVDEVFDGYVSYTSHFSKILFLLTLTVSLVIPVLLFDNSVAWAIWILAVVEVSISVCIVKWKTLKISSRFDSYEDDYVRG